jgi:hypothetical protein
VGLDWDARRPAEESPLSALAIAVAVFICCFCAALVGMILHFKLPNDHLDGDSKDVVKLVMGLIATMAALVLGLLIASAKSSYDMQATEIQQVATDIVQLDRMLALYGPETRETRVVLRQMVLTAYQQVWPADDRQPANLDPSITQGQVNTLYEALQNLSPKTDAQHRIQDMALQLGAGVSHVRTLMFEQLGASFSWPLLLVLVFWVSMLFLGFGMFARFNITVTAALFVGALSVACAIFLILELNQPYAGLMRVSSAPIRGALARMAQ